MLIAPHAAFDFRHTFMKNCFDGAREFPSGFFFGIGEGRTEKIRSILNVIHQSMVFYAFDFFM